MIRKEGRKLNRAEEKRRRDNASSLVSHQERELLFPVYEQWNTAAEFAGGLARYFSNFGEGTRKLFRSGFLAALFE